MNDLLLFLSLCFPLFGLFLAHIGFSEDRPLFTRAAYAMVSLGSVALLILGVTLS